MPKTFDQVDVRRRDVSVTISTFFISFDLSIDEQESKVDLHFKHVQKSGFLRSRRFCIGGCKGSDQ